MYAGEIVEEGAVDEIVRAPRPSLYPRAVPLPAEAGADKHARPLAAAAGPDSRAVGARAGLLLRAALRLRRAGRCDAAHPTLEPRATAACCRCVRADERLADPPPPAPRRQPRARGARASSPPR
jgi:ABC-type dipeptide/oligopeptide/nickel transport system ATPase component